MSASNGASKTLSAMSKKTTSSVSLGLNSQSGASVAHVDWRSEEDVFYTSRVQIAQFFRHHRLHSNVSLEQVREALSLDSIDIVSAYENGERSIPLEDLFSLTNLLNIPPEEVLALVFDSTSQQGLR